MEHRFRKLERIVRGVSCHRRIQILQLLIMDPGLDLITICRRAGINTKTGGEHTRRLYIAGLIRKKAKGRQVLHEPTPRGISIHEFLKTIE